ncbi:sensor histidine kinase [Maribellus sediminis]|uniref:sensor histidine kinase n=1 Tax=Maribellus sediminis TaxID=2696285 RepID=UPI00143136D3|nr:HAMP domain-containing sensor histidine kinase [Maribellus sediminis]
MFEEINLSTRDYPAQALDERQISQSVKTINDKQLIDFVESISQMVLILDEEQNIVYANQSFNSFFENKKISHIIGKKPGDSFSCRHSSVAGSICGTTKFCRSCGAAHAIRDAVQGNRSTKECKILTVKNEAIDLRVTASPVTLQGHKLTLFSISDISNEKRRRSLERIFIHDILNIAGGISGLSSIMKEIDDPEELKQIADTIEVAANNLVDEIQSQRELSSAERGDLTLHYTAIETSDILSQLQKLYSNHELNLGKEITIRDDANQSIVSDKMLIKRILGNMVKNAIEATVPNDHITISCIGLGRKVRFEVHNQSFIPEDVQLELFKRFYSTKQNGRGIGTYSMKLFGEKYLKGRVWFKSTAEEGTSFYFELSA